jgi:hypothetical protein
VRVAPPPAERWQWRTDPAPISASQHLHRRLRGSVVGATTAQRILCSERRAGHPNAVRRAAGGVCILSVRRLSARRQLRKAPTSRPRAAQRTDHALRLPACIKRSSAPSSRAPRGLGWMIPAGRRSGCQLMSRQHTPHPSTRQRARLPPRTLRRGLLDACFARLGATHLWHHQTCCSHLSSRLRMLPLHRWRVTPAWRALRQGCAAMTPATFQALPALTRKGAPAR